MLKNKVPWNWGIKISQQPNWRNSKYRKRLSKAGKNRKLSESHKKNIGKATRKNWQNSKFKKRMGWLISKGLQTPKAQRNLSQAHKGKKASEKAKKI